MTRHWLIRYNNKNEYVKVEDIFMYSQIDQVINYCRNNFYDLTKVLVVETATKYVYSNILKL